MLEHSGNIGHTKKMHKGKIYLKSLCLAWKDWKSKTGKNHYALLPVKMQYGRILGYFELVHDLTALLQPRVGWMGLSWITHWIDHETKENFTYRNFWQMLTLHCNISWFQLQLMKLFKFITMKKAQPNRIMLSSLHDDDDDKADKVRPAWILAGNGKLQSADELLWWVAMLPIFYLL